MAMARLRRASQMKPGSAVSSNGLNQKKPLCGQRSSSWSPVRSGVENDESPFPYAPPGYPKLVMLPKRRSLYQPWNAPATRIGAMSPTRIHGERRRSRIF